MLKKLLPTAYFLLPIVLILLILPLAAHAGLIPECALTKGICTINDIVQTFVNFMRLLLGFVGSAALLFFIYGGFMWLVSGGDAEKIKKGQAIVKNAIIGLIIVFAAATIVQFVSKGLGVREEFMIGQECVEGNTRGIWVPKPDDPGGQPHCATSCDGDPILGDAGYTCKVPGEGESCVFGLCLEPEACCKE